jgi:ESCRT-I complex subunit TSG101
VTQQLSGTTFAEMQSVDINLQELRMGQQKLREMLENMDREQRELNGILSIYQEKKAELEKALESYAVSQTENGDGNDVDKAIDATTPLHKQILRCYVDDCVVDDTIYFLGQALKKGTVDLPTYLKHVRHLSRQQFIARATMQKCRQRAKLPV